MLAEIGEGLRLVFGNRYLRAMAGEATTYNLGFTVIETVFLLYAVDERIATITLNRPDKRNAYLPQMGEDIVAAFRAARDDADVRAVILTGAGQGFCAGVDLDALKAMQAGTPFLATDEGNPTIGDYPAYMVEERMTDKRRSEVSRMLLREMHGVTFDDWKEAAWDTTLYWPLVNLPKTQPIVSVGVNAFRGGPKWRTASRSRSRVRSSGSTESSL